ncbi:MAG: NAD(P)H-hydrate dehydratase [bacterium]|nr:NAD(P)H-hydrate dehydratase [bacterium]
MKIVSGERMRELDRETIERYGIPGLELMENAGRGAAGAILREYPGLAAKGRVLILAGTGNNGGDGFVAARHLVKSRVEASVVLLGPREKVRGDARANLETWEKTAGKTPEILTSGELRSWQDRFNSYDLLVDALFGTGLNQEVKGVFAEAIRAMNESPILKAAMDIPSGIHATSGKVLGLAVKADLTVTFGLPKIGQVIHPGLEYVGKLVVVDIGFPEAVVKNIPDAMTLLDREIISALIPRRPPASHKGNYGHLLILAGSPGKTGAACLAARGAFKIGAGLVTVALPKSLASVVVAGLPEVMTEPLEETEAGTLSPSALFQLEKALEGKTALAVGPGFSTLPEVGEIIRGVIARSGVPILLDADGLTHLARNRALLNGKSRRTVITPHPGELARIFNTSTDEIQADRIGSARKAARELEARVVLKGARTVIAGPEGEVSINPTGNRGMAQGGMGDVLTGMIGGLLAQGLSLADASCLGVYLHGMAGDRIAGRQGPVGILASELADEIPFCIKELEK